MMPLEVQKQYSIEKFIVIQVLGQDEMLAGIYDPQWGLTLPSARHWHGSPERKYSENIEHFSWKYNPQRQTGIQSRFAEFTA